MKTAKKSVFNFKVSALKPTKTLSAVKSSKTISSVAKACILKGKNVQGL